MGWGDAQQLCQKENAHLAIVDAEAVEKAIKSVMVLRIHFTYSYWIDLRKKATEKAFVWAETGELPYFFRHLLSFFSLFRFHEPSSVLPFIVTLRVSADVKRIALVQ